MATSRTLGMMHTLCVTDHNRACLLMLPLVGQHLRENDGDAWVKQQPCGVQTNSIFSSDLSRLAVECAELGGELEQAGMDGFEAELDQVTVVGVQAEPAKTEAAADELAVVSAQGESSVSSSEQPMLLGKDDSVRADAHQTNDDNDDDSDDDDDDDACSDESDQEEDAMTCSMG